MNAINPIPDGHDTVTPYLTVNDAASALTFYANAFGAEERLRLHMPNGHVAHAQFNIGASNFMISDEHPHPSSTAPKTLGGSTVKLHLYVTDVDAAFSRAIAAGATEVMAPADHFWGDRMGELTDPFGHHWMLATHVADVDSSEFQSRMDAMFAANTKQQEA